MITVQEFMDCYNAAKEGRQVYRRVTHYGYIENYYEHEKVNFLNLPMNEIIQEDDKVSIDYYVRDE